MCGVGCGMGEEIEMLKGVNNFFDGAFRIVSKATDLFAAYVDDVF